MQRASNSSEKTPPQALLLLFFFFWKQTNKLTKTTQKVNFSGKTECNRPSRRHRHVLGRASALRTPHACHPPPGTAGPRPRLVPPAASRRPPPPPLRWAPVPLRWPRPVPRRRRLHFSVPAPPVPNAPRLREGGSGGSPLPAPWKAGRGSGGRRTYSRRCPAVGCRLGSGGGRLERRSAAIAAASHGGAGLMAGYFPSLSGARWVWKPVTTCQDGVAPNPPPRERGEGLSELGEARPSRGATGSAFPGARRASPLPGPARPRPIPARPGQPVGQPRAPHGPRGAGADPGRAHGRPRGWRRGRGGGEARRVCVWVGGKTQSERWLEEKLNPSASSHGFQVECRGASRGEGAVLVGDL